MGGSLSTIRWTPYGPLTGNDPPSHRSRQALRKSKSFPPSNTAHSPSTNSTSNTSFNEYYEEEFYDELDTGNNNGGGNSTSGNSSDHHGTSGILMGINAPPLYDACLVGRWDDVLEICGVNEEQSAGTENTETSPATMGTHCSSSSDSAADHPTEEETDQQMEVETGWPNDDGGNNTPSNSTTTNTNTNTTTAYTSNHPCLQTRYSDRRRNTPLHLACRRQPPPSVVRALLNHSPCGSVSRRTADGLTPLHFAAYCGAGVEVISMLVDRMRSDAAVGRAMMLSSALDEVDEVGSGETTTTTTTTTTNNGSGGGQESNHVPQQQTATQLPPTRLLDRRQRTPLHCALSGFRTPIRPLIVRKLLAVDPASATLGDERGRTPLSLLFDDYAEEIMEALDDCDAKDEARELVGGMASGGAGLSVQERIAEGGELHECWKMLRVLLQAAYQGSVWEDEEEEKMEFVQQFEKKTSLQQQQQQHNSHELQQQQQEEEGSDNPNEADNSEPPPQAAPQDRQPHPVPSSQSKSSSPAEAATTAANVMEMYDHEHFSMVHAAAGVWECPAPLAKLVLKCLCSTSSSGSGKQSGSAETTTSYYDNDWDHALESPTESSASFNSNTTSNNDSNEDDVNLIRQPDEETMRLPLHIAVCARPQCREGYSARLKTWLSSVPEATSRQYRGAGPQNINTMHSSGSVISTTGSMATHPGSRFSKTGQVYNPRFGRSPSRDSVVAYTSSQRRGGGGGNGTSSAANLNSSISSNTSFQGFNISRSTSNSSMFSGMPQEQSFLQHTMVRDVLNLYPAAASVVDDRTNKLPIVLAIEHGKSWETAVGPLLEAYPTPFGGGGDGGMALPDDSAEGQAHREALERALFLALSSPEVVVREEAIRTAGKLAEWGGVYGMEGSLDNIVGEWLATMKGVCHNGGDNESSSSTGGPGASSPEGIIIGPDTTTDHTQTQSSHLTAVAQVVASSRPSSISDSVARSCLDTSREYLFSKQQNVREAAARVLGNTLNSVGDGEDAANVMREVVLLNLGMTNDGDGGSVGSGSGAGGRAEEDVIVKHGRLLACNSILSTQWGYELLSTQDICNATLVFIHKCVKDKNTVVRCAAYIAMGPILGKSPSPPNDPSKIASSSTAAIAAASTLTMKEMRSDILKGTRASEHVHVQLSLARGLTSASRMSPNLFLCKSGMPIMDAALMLAMSSSSARPNVQKAFQMFLWVALRMGGSNGGRGDGSDGHHDDGDAIMDNSLGGDGRRGNNYTADYNNHDDPMMSPGLEKYIALAEGENGIIMMKFVTQTLAKIEDLDDQ